MNQDILTIALAFAGLLTPIVIAAGVRDRALNDRLVTSERTMNEKLEKVRDDLRDANAEAAAESRTQFVRERDFTQAITRLENSQREFREDTKAQVDQIHDDIRNILTTLARMESARKQ